MSQSFHPGSHTACPSPPVQPPLLREDTGVSVNGRVQEESGTGRTPSFGFGLCSSVDSRFSLLLKALGLRPWRAGLRWTDPDITRFYCSSLGWTLQGKCRFCFLMEDLHTRLIIIRRQWWGELSTFSVIHHEKAEAGRPWGRAGSLFLCQAKEEAGSAWLWGTWEGWLQPCLFKNAGIKGRAQWGNGPKGKVPLSTCRGHTSFP